jgi:DNA-directed RNA polymerase specialized sigma24 family protein
MALPSAFSEPLRLAQASTSKWSKLYSFLRPRVERWVYSSHMSSWRGQEEDLVDDIVQEAVIRTLKYARRAEQGEVSMIASFEGFSLKIAHNYLQDWRRRDWRLSRFITDDRSSGLPVILSNGFNVLDDITDYQFLESVIVMLPAEIVKFPAKQQKALLIDLANRMHFGAYPTLLQGAFLKVGVQMQDYQQALPEDPVELSRHRSLVSIAYKRVANLPCVKQYIAA